MSLQMLTDQSTSSIRCYRRCPRLYKHQYLDLVRPAKVPAPLLIGTAFHHACEVFWTGADADEILNNLDELFAGDHYWASDKGKYQVAKIKAMAWNYHKMWASSRSKYDVIATEEQIKFRVIDSKQDSVVSNDIHLVGKFDAIVKEKETERHWLIETKTTANDIEDQSSAYWEKLALDLQLSVYAEALGMQYDNLGIIYDVARKPRQRPKKSKGIVTESQPEFYRRVRGEIATDPEKYFVRKEIHRTSKQNLAIIDEAKETVRQIFLTTGFPRNDSACTHAGQSCAFLGVCTGTDRLDSSNFVKGEHPHPELNNG